MITTIVMKLKIMTRLDTILEKLLEDFISYLNVLEL